MDELKILYNQFLKDKRTYNLNVGYWRIKLQKALEEKIYKSDILFKNKNSKGKNFYDGNPIFSYYSNKHNKAFRVIQEDANEIENLNDIKLIEAWIDNIQISSSPEDSEVKEVKELVISLFLTNATVDKCVLLIKEWFLGQLDSTNIENILSDKMTDKKFAVVFDTNSYRGFVQKKSTYQVLADIAELKKAEAKKNIKAFGIVIVGTEMLGNLSEGASGYNYNDCLNGVIAMANHCFDETLQGPRIIPPPYLLITHSFFDSVPEEYESKVKNMSGVINDFRIDFTRAIAEHKKLQTFEQIKNYLDTEELTFANEIITLIEGSRQEILKNNYHLNEKQLSKKLLEFFNSGDYEMFISFAIIEATARALNSVLTAEEKQDKALTLKKEFPLSVGFYKWISNQIVTKKLNMQSKTSKQKRWNWIWDYQVCFIMSNPVSYTHLTLPTSDLV